MLNHGGTLNFGSAKVYLPISLNTKINGLLQMIFI